MITIGLKMPHFHVTIAKKSGTRWAFAFNLSKEQVLEKIVKPFSRWQPFMCGVSPIEPSDVDSIRINETVESASQIIRKTKWRRIFSRFFGGFGEARWEGYANEWYITHAGKDVTRDFIKDVDLSKKALRTFEMEEPVFIIHGKDVKPVQELKQMLEELGISSIVLHEEASKGKTVLEKLEEYAGKVGYVFVVLTPDDLGASLSRIATYSKRHPDKKLFGALKARPRQNVIFEFGYFAGKLGRNRVCYLKKGNPILPSDIEGMVYIPFQKSMKKSKGKIIKELKAAGYEIKI